MFPVRLVLRHSLYSGKKLLPSVSEFQVTVQAVRPVSLPDGMAMLIGPISLSLPKAPSSSYRYTVAFVPRIPWVSTSM